MARLGEARQGGGGKARHGKVIRVEARLGYVMFDSTYSEFLFHKLAVFHRSGPASSLCQCRGLQLW